MVLLIEVGKEARKRGLMLCFWNFSKPSSSFRPKDEGDMALWGKFRSFWDIHDSLSHERGSERSERSGACEQSEQSGATSEQCKRMSE